MSAWSVHSSAEGWTVPGYVEERLVGQGASGRVVAAVSEATGQRVAIKYLNTSLVREPSFMWVFRTEAQTLKSLDVPQVVHLYDYIEAPGPGAASRTPVRGGGPGSPTMAGMRRMNGGAANRLFDPC